ncbi:MAG: UDP-N-acetylmuramate dehydrogenase [Gammaproteobacteria bacterium]|nr:UDP-N-acetylmuramate dehydrogenase [Gammaproteobacteria bacterium]
MSTVMVDTHGLTGRLLLDEPMARHSSWRTGGPARRFYVPADLDDLAVFLSRLPSDETIFWVGLGSNLLVRDGGLEGTVICTQGVLDGIVLESDSTIVAGAGLPTAQLARFCAREGLSGCEFMAGIPGTVGGALAMNAGALGSETWDFVRAVQVIDRSGEICWRDADSYEPTYRHVPRPDDEWFVGARFGFAPGEPEAVADAIRDCLKRRADTQPTGQSSCGSVFRNPPGDFAGRLVEAAGLKGYRVGGAVVSEKHANFIVNEGSASAADIERLIVHVQGVIRERFGIDLIPEVQIVGLEKVTEARP